MHMRNIEPRRFWRLRRYRPVEPPIFDLEGPIEKCRTCGADAPLGEWRGEWFCTECLEQATQGYLAPDYDDLGGPG